ncbi:MAG: hypothetical protein NTY45_06735 [Elusimicrobia bacterium]|nr:hypothetical protein [Elusimicrobiota bacterium]
MKRVLGKLSVWSILGMDGAAVLLSWFLAFQLRFDFHLPDSEFHHFLNGVPLILLARLFAFHYFGLYRGLWRYASMPDLLAIFKAVISSQVIIAAIVLFTNHASYPRSVLLIGPVLTILLVGGIRFAIRATREWRYSHKNVDVNLPRVLIYGAGDLGESVLRDIQRAKKQ